MPSARSTLLRGRRPARLRPLTLHFFRTCRPRRSTRPRRSRSGLTHARRSDASAATRSSSSGARPAGWTSASCWRCCRSTVRPRSKAADVPACAILHGPALESSASRLRMGNQCGEDELLQLQLMPTRRWAWLPGCAAVLAPAPAARWARRERGAEPQGPQLAQRDARLARHAVAVRRRLRQGRGPGEFCTRCCSGSTRWGGMKLAARRLFPCLPGSGPARTARARAGTQRPAAPRALAGEARPFARS